MKYNLVFIQYLKSEF